MRRNLRKHGRPPRRAVVLIMVLLVVALLAISAYAFSSLMITERKAALLGVDRAQSRLAVDSGAAAWQAGYWRIQGSGFSKKNSLAMHEALEGDLQPTERWERVRPQVLARLRTLVHGIRNGEFPMQNADDKCTSVCPFNTVCRVGQVRSLKKAWESDPQRVDDGESNERIGK